jgi:hypothetical protein
MGIIILIKNERLEITKEFEAIALESWDEY